MSANLTAIAAAFGTGAATSIGPCAAPRYLALAAIVADARGAARWTRVGLFALGLVACYLAIAQTATLLHVLIRSSAIVYALLALASLIFGLQSLRTSRSCAHAHGATMLAGGALGLVVSPCCTPVIALSAGIAAAASPYEALLCAAAFACGHIALLATIGIGVQAARFGEAARTIGGALAIALAGYYGLLA
jgi:hypothetical protein